MPFYKWYTGNLGAWLKPPNMEIFSSQAPKYGNFPFTSPFSFRGNDPFTSPPLRKSGPHTPTWKKVECPPPPVQLLLALIVARYTAFRGQLARFIELLMGLESENFKSPNWEIFSSQAPKFGNFQFTSPQVWTFSIHKPPSFRGNRSFHKPPTSESGPHTPTWKKVECPPPPGPNYFWPWL